MRSPWGVRSKVSGIWETGAEVLARGEALEARFLVIASGYQSPLKEAIRGRDRRDHYGVCMVTEFPEEDALIDARLPGLLGIHFCMARMGLRLGLPSARILF